MMEDQNKVQLCPDGKYRWAYEVNMYKNPTIFYMIGNMFLISYLVCIVIFSIVNLCIGEDVLMTLLMLTGIFLFIFLVSIPAYLVVASIMGGTYAALFVMDDKGIEHHQMQKKVKKLELLSAIAGMVGAAKGDMSMVGLSIFSASAQVTKSSFDKVRTVKKAPGRNLIKLSEGWYSKNHIYVEELDYEFVYRFILEHCQNLDK